jgi:Glycosyl transferase family 2
VSAGSGGEIDVLVPTRNRPGELATTLAGLACQDGRYGPEGQRAPEFGVVVSDQSDDAPAWEHGAAAGTVRILRHRGHPVLLCRHLPRRGMAEQRAFLLERSRARYVLSLDDDVWLEPDAVARMVAAIKELRCGFVGNFPHGLSYLDDHRPEQEKSYREWTGRPEPERIVPRGPEWKRANLHAAANLLHLTQRLDLAPGQWRAYRVAWLGACVLYDRAALVAAGGYDFWRRVPAEHSGEDAAAQLRVLARAGGAGLLPSGAYHLETPTTVPERRMECFDEPVLARELSAAAGGRSASGERSSAAPEGLCVAPGGRSASVEGQELGGGVDDLDDRDVGDERR